MRSIVDPARPRILITRLSAIGDCVHAMPLVAAIRESYPHAYIAWATQEQSTQLLQGMHGLDELIVVDRGWMKRPASFAAARRRLRKLRFDISIDPQSLAKSSLLGWISGAPIRIGFGGSLGREFSRWLNNHKVSPRSTHVVDRYLELLKCLDIVPTDVDFAMPHFDDARHNVDDYLCEQRVERFALLNPGAGWRSKLWPADRYAQVADHLADVGVQSIVLWAGDEEYKIACSISEKSSAIVAPKTSLQELAEISRRAELFVGSDTGPTHIAAAVGTSCVAMYGPTSAETCGPAGENHICLQSFLQTGSSRTKRRNDDRAMRAIDVADVSNAIDRLLGTSLSRRDLIAAPV